MGFCKLDNMEELEPLLLRSLEFYEFAIYWQVQWLNQTVKFLVTTVSTDFRQNVFYNT